MERINILGEVCILLVIVVNTEPKQKKPTKILVGLLILTILTVSFACGFRFHFLLNAWFYISFFLSDVTNNAIFLTFSLESLDCAIKSFVFAKFNGTHFVFTPLLNILDEILAKIFTLVKSFILLFLEFRRFFQGRNLFFLNLGKYALRRLLFLG